MSQAFETLAVPFRNPFHCPVQVYPGERNARTLLVLPALYYRAHRRDEEGAAA